MDAVEFLKEWKRRTQSESVLYADKIYISSINPENLVSQVEQWAKDHPVKTRKSEFLKMFQNAKLCEGLPLALPCHIDINVRDKNGDCGFMFCSDCRRAYWLQEVE